MTFIHLPNLGLTHLRNKGLFSSKPGSDNVHFLETKNQKISMIDQLNCSFFVDDHLKYFQIPTSLKSLVFSSTLIMI